MKEFNFNNVLHDVTHHASVLLKGIARTLYGTLIAGLIGFAIYGFVQIRAEGGYAAVFDFIASCAILVIALANAYALGNKKRGKKK